MKWFFLCIALVAASTFLALEHARGTVLRAELEQLRHRRAEWEMQQQERARLVALQPTSEERLHLEKQLALRAERQRTIEHAERERPEAQRVPVGEWFPPTRWLDSGEVTPGATVHTMLWAAAGGDTGRLARLLHLDEDARAKLDRVFAMLPVHTRATYASAEELLAAFTAKSIPAGDTQIVWQQQSDNDAVVCFWINNPEVSSSGAAPEKRATDPKVPPMLPPNPSRSQGLLALRRSHDGWRIVVPAYAIDRLSRELALK